MSIRLRPLIYTVDSGNWTSPSLQPNHGVKKINKYNRVLK